MGPFRKENLSFTKFSFKETKTYREKKLISWKFSWKKLTSIEELTLKITLKRCPYRNPYIFGVDGKLWLRNDT